MESERVFENQKKELDHTKEVVKKVFANFWKRSDEPGEFLSSVQKDKLSEASRFDPEAFKKWEENRNSKYRRNSLSAPLMAIELFFTSDESQDIPEAIKEEIKRKMEKAREDISNKRETKLTKDEVNQVEELVREIEKYIGQ